MRKDKDKVIALRREGKSYRDIQKIVPISRATLSLWFRGIPELEEIKKGIIEREIKRRPEHLKAMRDGAARKWQEYYRRAEEEASNEFVVFKDEPLFVAGLMIYLGEGTKIAHLNVANSDEKVLRLFLKFLYDYCGTRQSDVRLWLLLYPDLDIIKTENHWLELLGLGRNNLHKSQVIQGRHKTRRLSKGVGNIRLSNTYLKAKIMKWIDLLTDDLLV